MPVINRDGKAIPSYFAQWRPRQCAAVGETIRDCPAASTIALLTRRPAHRYRRRREAINRTMTQLGVPRSGTRQFFRNGASLPADHEFTAYF